MITILGGNKVSINYSSKTITIINRDIKRRTITGTKRLGKAGVFTIIQQPFTAGELAVTTRLQRYGEQFVKPETVVIRRMQKKIKQLQTAR